MEEKNGKIKYLDIPIFMKLLYLMDGLNTFNAQDIYAKIKMTYSHYVKMLRVFEEMGWLILKRDGRLVVATVTDKGREAISVTVPAVKFYLNPTLKESNYVF